MIVYEKVIFYIVEMVGAGIGIFGIFYPNGAYCRKLGSQGR
jgi:hypothetical protein